MKAFQKASLLSCIACIAALFGGCREESPFANRSNLTYKLQSPNETVQDVLASEKSDWNNYNPHLGVRQVAQRPSALWVRLASPGIEIDKNWLLVLSCPLLEDIYQDGEHLKSMRNSKDESAKKWPIVELRPSPEPSEILLKLRPPSKGAFSKGSCQKIEVGSEYEVTQHVFSSNFTRFFFGMIFVFLGLLSVISYFFKRNLVVLHFSLFAILIGLTFTGSTELAWYLSGLQQDWWHYWQFFVFLFPIPFLLFVEDVIPTKYRLCRHLAIIHSVWFMLFVIAQSFPFGISDYVIRSSAFALMIIEALFILPIGIYSFSTSSLSSKLLGAAIIVVTFSAINDLLHITRMIESLIISEWSALLFFINCLVIISASYMDQEKQLEAEKRLRLEDYNQQLEADVKARTEDIRKKTEALIVANKELEDRNLLLKTSNKKMEDLIYKKNLILNRVETIEQKNISNLQHILNNMKQEANGSSINQALFELRELSNQLKPLTSFYRSEKAIEDKYILLVEADKKQQKIMKMALGGSRIQLDIVENAVDAQEAFKVSKYDILIINHEYFNVAKFAHSLHENLKIILMTYENIDNHIDDLRSYEYISNIIFRDESDPIFTSRNILTTITKIINEDFFGLEKYLSWGVEVQEFQIKTSRERRHLIDRLISYLQTAGVRKSVVNKATLISDELLMNAIYDAPVDENRIAKYNHLSRTDQVDLLPEEYGRFRFAFDGVMLAISAEDPFGALTRKTIMDYVKSCFDGEYGSINVKEGKGGGGLGLYQILSSSDLVVVNVKKNLRTEFIAIINLMSPRKGQRDINSFHYFAS